MEKDETEVREGIERQMVRYDTAGRQEVKLNLLLDCTWCCLKKFRTMPCKSSFWKRLSSGTVESDEGGKKT